MDNFLKLVEGRRSIRRYKPEEISADSVKSILEAALMAPTSKNSRPWHFVIVEDSDKLNALAKCKPTGALPVANCALAIVVAADVEKSEAWIEDCAIAATYIQLEAQDQGLGTCWIQVRGRYYNDEMESETYVQNLLEMPDNIMPVCIITIGYADETRSSQNLEKLQWEKVHIGEWRER